MNTKKNMFTQKYMETLMTMEKDQEEGCIV